MGRELEIFGSNSRPDLPPCTTGADEQLAAEGWVRRHSADADRAKESIELYESLGFEVLTRKLTSADYDPVCRDCIANTCSAHVLIYTRKRAGRAPGHGEQDDQEA